MPTLAASQSAPLSSQPCNQVDGYTQSYSQPLPSISSTITNAIATDPLALPPHVLPDDIHSESSHAASMHFHQSTAMPSCLLSHKKPCLVQGCPEFIAPTMWRQHMSLHARRLFPGPIPNSWLQEQNRFVCPNCQQLVANSHSSSHSRKCSHATSVLVQPPFQSQSDIAFSGSPPPLPTFETVCQLPGRTVRHIPVKDRLAFALVLSSSLRAALHENTEEAWLKVFMLPKCLLLVPKHRGRHHKPVPIRVLCDMWSKGDFGVLWNRAVHQQHTFKPTHSFDSRAKVVQYAVSLAREGLLSKACQTLTSSGLAPNNNTTWDLLNLKHPKGPPTSPPSLPTSSTSRLPLDFDIMAVMHSFPKETACGPSGLRIQHLIEAAEVPLQFPISTTLLEVVNLLASGKVPTLVARYLAGENLVALEKTKPNSPPDIRPIAVGEALRRLTGKCLCALTKNKAYDFFPPLQLGVACPSGAEQIIHSLRHCVDEHWMGKDFAILKIDLRNAFRQAVVDTCGHHYPELLEWTIWCYGQHPILLHTLGTIFSETEVQQGNPLGPLLFCLVLHHVVSAIANDEECVSLLFHKWYIDDGVVAGPIPAIARVLSIIQELGPQLGLFINSAKCELFSASDLSLFPIEMKKSNVPHFEILGAPIGDMVCAKYVAQKLAEATKVLKELEEVGSIDPQVALLLLWLCGSFCRLVHLARTTPPSLVNEAFELFDDNVRRCFAECTAVDVPDTAWQQAQLSLSR